MGVFFIYPYQIPGNFRLWIRNMEIRDYIASQITPEGMDELQRLTLAYILGYNVALDGPPGVGKTQSVIAFGKLVNKNVFEKGCSEDTTENQIIGFPKLIEENGATITSYENGPLTKAMEAGGFFYGDEFNLLRRDKQKRLNSAFDDRRRIQRADDVEIKAKPGFMAVIAYNPTRALSVQDLEDSVADRFLHFHYQYMSPRIEAYVGALRSAQAMGRTRPSAESYAIQLEKRALVLRVLNGKLAARFYIYDPGSSKWFDVFSKKAPELDIDVAQNNLSKDQLVSIYYAAKQQQTLHVNSKPIPQGKEIEVLLKDFSLKATGFFNIIRQMTEIGAAGLPPAIKSAYSGIAEAGQLVVHLPSLRVQSAALSHIDMLIQMGMDYNFARQYAGSLLVDQICFGKYRDRKNGEFTNYEIVSVIASSFGLLSNDLVLKLNTNLTGTKKA
jgi:hypothetical protein